MHVGGGAVRFGAVLLFAIYLKNIKLTHTIIPNILLRMPHGKKIALPTLKELLFFGR